MLKIFSIRDEKTEEFKTPFFAASEIEATRSFAVACNDKNVQLSLFPDEYSLYILGYFEDTCQPTKQELIVPMMPLFVIGGAEAKKMIKEKKS